MNSNGSTIRVWPSFSFIKSRNLSPLEVRFSEAYLRKNCLRFKNSSYPDNVGTLDFVDLPVSGSTPAGGLGGSVKFLKFAWGSLKLPLGPGKMPVVPCMIISLKTTPSDSTIIPLRVADIFVANVSFCVMDCGGMSKKYVSWLLDIRLASSDLLVEIILESTIENPYFTVLGFLVLPVHLLVSGLDTPPYSALYRLRPL